MAITVINISKEVIETQKLGEGFSISVDSNGSILITPQAIKEVRKGWAEIIEKYEGDINDDEYLQDWMFGAPYLLTPID